MHAIWGISVAEFGQKSKLLLQVFYLFIFILLPKFLLSVISGKQHRQ